MLETGITPDFITVDGAGAAPVEFTNRLGLICLEGISIVNNALVGVGLRDKIKTIAAGKTASSFDLFAKIAAGADVVNAARTMMMAIGCIQSRHCNTNLCPTGIATQDPARAKVIDVDDKSERVKNFHHNTLASFFELVGSMGLNDPAKLVPQMVKRCSPYGAQMSMGSIVAPLPARAFIDNLAIDESWQHWWYASSAEQFYVEDLFILKSPEFHQVKTN